MNTNRMINSSVCGAATLLMALVLVTVCALTVVFAANYSHIISKSVANQVRSEQAFQAAQGGLEFGIAYLLQNTSTVTANPVSGYINYGSSDSNITNVTLANSSKYSVVYTDPTANNYQVLIVTSTGVNDDGSSTKIISQKISTLSNNVNSSITAGGNVSLVGGSVITNTITNINLQAAGTLTINNGASTVTSSGTSTVQGNIKSDVQQNVAALQGMTEPQFFQSVVGTTKASAQAQAQSGGNYYNNSVAGGDYSQTLKNKSGVTIYINQANVSLGQGVSIGTAANPVTIIVNGNLTIANGVTIYGYVYSSNQFTLAGGATLTGGIVSYGSMNISNNFRMRFQAVPKISGMGGSYVKLPGSWRDF